MHLVHDEILKKMRSQFNEARRRRGPAVQCKRMRLHGVVGRLDSRDVDAPKLGRRLEVAPERARLAEPGHLRPPPGLLGDLQELRRVAAPATGGLQL